MDIFHIVILLSLMGKPKILNIVDVRLEQIKFITGNFITDSFNIQQHKILVS